MGHKEAEIIKKRLLALADNERLFRINAGMGWQGQTVKHDGQVIILKNPRPFHGAPNGWPDLTGWQTVEITPDMVGQKVAIFTGVEVKAPGDRMRPDQERLRDVIRRMGGQYHVITE
jgi:hypothetical protein